MNRRRLSPLEGALLGLLNDEPRSGYALRKLFATTPMGNFSDSPGSIYPALARLAAQGLIAGNVENARSLRPRQVYHVTDQGLDSLKFWLGEPMAPGGMSEDFGLLLLRFVFMPQTIGRAETVRFLARLETELTRQVAELRKFYRQAARGMPTPGRLGLRAGIEICAAHVRWASLAHQTLGRRKKDSRRSSS
jgi:DNA-binding PadR family transcriptional regulator